MNEWRIQWNDTTFTADDLTGADAVLLQTLTGIASFEACDPTGSPNQLVSMIALCEHKSSALSLGQAMTEVQARPLSDLLDALSVVPQEG